MTQIQHPAVAITCGTRCNCAVTLIASTGGLFQTALNGAVIRDRRKQGGFPDGEQLKQTVRDRLWPGRDLGHIDRRGTKAE